MRQNHTSFAPPAVAILLLILPILTWAQADSDVGDRTFTHTYTFGFDLSPAGERLDIHLVSAVPPASTESVLPSSVSALVSVSSANADPFLIPIEDVFTISRHGIDTLSIYAVPAAALGTYTLRVAGVLNDTPLGVLTLADDERVTIGLTLLCDSPCPGGLGGSGFFVDSSDGSTNGAIAIPAFHDYIIHPKIPGASDEPSGSDKPRQIEVLSFSWGSVGFGHERAALLLSLPPGSQPAGGTDSTTVALRVSTPDGTELGSPLVAPTTLTLSEGGAASATFSAACDAAGSSCEILVDTGFGPQPLPGLVEPTNGRITLKVEVDCDHECPGGLGSQTTVIGGDGQTRAATRWGFTNAYPNKWKGPAVP